MDEGGGIDDGDDDEDDVAELFVTIMDAVAIDNRERTRSSGYVVPAIKGKKSVKQTKRKVVRASQIGRTDRSDASQSTAGQSSGGIQLFLPI
jgi:hypothetical protein